VGEIPSPYGGSRRIPRDTFVSWALAGVRVRSDSVRETPSCDGDFRWSEYFLIFSQRAGNEDRRGQTPHSKDLCPATIARDVGWPAPALQRIRKRV
jgi:hypothetical protein